MSEPPKLMRLPKLLDLLCPTEPLLELVDCDHRSRFSRPSFTPPKLLERLWVALDRRRGRELAGALLEKLVLPPLTACATKGTFCGASPGSVLDGEEPGATRCWTVTTEELFEELVMV